MGVSNKTFLAAAVAFAAALDVFAQTLPAEECKRLAAAGDAEALWQLGCRYEKGDGVAGNPAKALSQYRKAADKGHKEACARLAEMYEKGEIVGKDPVKAAEYRAMAAGEDPKSAVAEAEKNAVRNKNKIDEIEIALDYIFGRNGKPKDAKTGIRMLYAKAKDDPTAQRVFVDRWSAGDLDGALSALDNEEWSLIIPWFRDAWNRGKKDVGLVLGYESFRQKNYNAAISYWKGSGHPKSWYFVGKLYDPSVEEEDGGGPKHMRNETLARRAYEQCLHIDSKYDDAKFSLGLIYLFPEKKENGDAKKAFNIFSYFIKQSPDNKWINYDYGVAGLLSMDYKARDAKRKEDEYLSYIRKAARLGCEPAKKLLDDFERDSRRGFR